MYLVRLVYFSRAVTPLTLAELAALLDHAQRRNTEDGITGKLCAHKEWFLQALEGGRDAVNETYRRIQADERHCDVTLLSYEVVDRRCFAGWSMAYAGVSEASIEAVQRFTPGHEFDPRRLLPGAACGLLEALPSLVVPTAAAA